MTGLATLVRGRFQADELAFQEAGTRIWGICAEYRAALWIGWERFTVNASTHKKTSQPDALKMIGVADWIATTWGCHILQPAGQHTPDTADQQRLKALGWWVPGKDDAQSAAAHMLRWLMQTGSLPPREAGILSSAR
jgi:hypothetical protein